MKQTNALLLLRKKRNLLFWYTGVIWRGSKGQKLVQWVIHYKSAYTSEMRTDVEKM